MAILDWAKLLQDRIENGADPLSEYNNWLRSHGFVDPLIDALNDKSLRDFANEIQLIIADDKKTIAIAELKIYIDTGNVLH